jgi:putative ABC transport system substrate-binding protein
MLGDHDSQNRTRNRWAILAGVVVLSLLLTACGGAKPKTYTIGVINFSSNLEYILKDFKAGLTELGYVEGENITYIYEGPVSADELDAVAQDLVKAKVNLILAITTPATKAAQKATAGTDIPVIFIPVTDPVGAGVVASLIKPGGNLTGVTYTTQEGRRLEWLLQVAPTIKQVYVVYNPEDQSPVLALKMVSESAAKLGVELATREASTPEEIEAAFQDIPKEADAIFFLPDTKVYAQKEKWIKLAVERKLPTSGPNVTTVNDGALTAYGVDLGVAAKQQAARLANQILQGGKPADLPVEMADYFSAINLQAARAIGLDIPDSILRQADTILR